MNFKELSLKGKIFIIIMIGLLLPLICVFLLFYSILWVSIFPFEYPKYKKSLFYRKFKKKYYFGITKKENYQLYNYITLNKLKVRYTSQRDGYHYLRYNNIVYLFSWFEEIDFDSNGNCIVADTDNDEFINLKEAIDIEKRKVRYKKPGYIYKVIISKKDYYNKLYYKDKFILKDNCDLLYIYENIEDLKKL